MSLRMQFGDTANAIKYLGTHYTDPRAGIAEQISNALDEHRKSDTSGPCVIEVELQEDTIIIQYPYGMSEEKFRKELQDIANCGKQDLEVEQIGRFGIGLFSFMRMGKKAEFLSKANPEDRCTKVTISEGTDKVDINTPKKREVRKHGLDEQAGICIKISRLKSDPTDGRKKLGWSKLPSHLSRKFSSFLRSGDLEIRLKYPANDKVVEVEPPSIDLPRIAENFGPFYIKGDEEKEVSLQLYHHPEGNGVVKIRQAGVVVVEDVSEMDDDYGLAESVFGSGDLHGFIDADFLKPLPSRNAFEETEDWFHFLVKLDEIEPALQAEIQKRKREREMRKKKRMQKQAAEIVEKIFDEDEILRELELFEGGDSPDEPLPQFPDGGFGFVPGSLRVTPGKSDKIPLRVLEPDALESGTEVQFSADEDFVQIEPKSAVVESENADEYGMVKIPVTVTADDTITDQVAILEACTKNFSAEAPIHVAEKAETRETGGSSGNSEKEASQGHPSYNETVFEAQPYLHSRFHKPSNTVEVNEAHRNFTRWVDEGDEKTMLFYSSLLYAKQTIAFNDSSGVADKYLEQLLSFLFRLMEERLDPEKIV